MSDFHPLPENKKLRVTYRVEPGCLGPEGKQSIDAFCVFAEKSIRTLDADYVIWHIIPRHDKSLPEMQFSVLGKSMNHSQAEKYLQIVGKSLDEFEEHLGDRLAELIDRFIESQAS